MIIMDNVRTTDLLPRDSKTARIFFWKFFFFLPLVISVAIMSSAALLTHKPAAAAFVVLLSLPILMLAIGSFVLQMAMLLSDRGKYKLAEYLYYVAGFLMGVFRFGPIRNFQQVSVSMRAELASIQGEYAKAEKLYEKNARLSQTQGASGQDILHSRYASVMWKSMGICRYSAGDFGGAAVFLERALILTLRELYENDTTIGMPEQNAQLNEEQVVKFANLVTKKLKPGSLQFIAPARMVLYLAANLRAQQKLSASIAVMNSIWPLFEEHYPPEDPEFFRPYMEYAIFCHDTDQIDSCKKYFRRANQIAHKSFNKHHPYLKLIKEKAESCKTSI